MIRNSKLNKLDTHHRAITYQNQALDEYNSDNTLCSTTGLQRRTHVGVGTGIPINSRKIANISMNQYFLEHLFKSKTISTLLSFVFVYFICLTIEHRLVIWFDLNATTLYFKDWWVCGWRFRQLSKLPMLLNLKLTCLSTKFTREKKRAANSEKSWVIL